VSRQQTRLRCMPTQTVLSKRSIAQDPARHPMNTPETLPGRLLTQKTLRSHDVSARRSRCGSQLEAYPEAWAASIAWTTRRPGRVCSCCRRPEPAAARVASRSAPTRSGSVHRVALEVRRERQGRQIKAGRSLTKWPIAHRQQADFCNTIGTFETCLHILTVSVHRGRPEVAVVRPNRRE
jgi:hypothetical protein